MNNNGGPPPYINFSGTQTSFYNSYWAPQPPLPPPIQHQRQQFSTVNPTFYDHFATSQYRLPVHRPFVQDNNGRNILRQENSIHPRFLPSPSIGQNSFRPGCFTNDILTTKRVTTSMMASRASSACSNYDASAGSPILSQAQDNSTSDHQGVALAYIDNSNIWINTMESSAKLLGFKGDIKQDLRTRINVNKLLEIAAAGRPIIRAVLYGSEPPPISKFWNNIKEIRFCKVDVQVTRRSTYSNREREVDQSIMLDIGVDLVIHQNHTKYGGTIIIFTGDGGMVTAVRRALEYGWNVELWAYRNSLAKGYLEEVEKNEKFKIVYLDDHFQEFVFYKFEWNTRIPQERSCVLTFRKIPDNQKPNLLELFVKALSQLVRMPMAGRFFKVSEESDFGENGNQTHLVIVCSVGKLILKEDSRSDFYLKCKDNFNTQQKNGHYGAHNSNSSRKNHNSFHFSQEHWDRIPDILNFPFLKEDPGDFNTRVKAEFEFLIEDSLRNTAESIDNPKYDFNQEIYRKIQNAITFKPNSSQSKQISNLPISTKQSAENTDLMMSEEINQLIRRYKPFLRSLPQFLQDLKLSHDHEEFEPLVLEAQGEDDDGEGNFTVQMFKKHKKKFQQYSEYCKYSFRCSNGFKCRYNHTAKEKEFFKLQPDSKLRKTYKYEACDYYANNTCKFKKATSYMCPFSHGHFCLTCKIDDDGGHNATSCPAASPTRSQSVVGTPS